MWRALAFVAVMACGGTSSNGETDACSLFDEGIGCPECADGDVTCSLDGVEVTRLSCGGCQARAALLEELCNAGSTVTEAEIDADGVCVDAE